MRGQLCLVAIGCTIGFGAVVAAPALATTRTLAAATAGPTSIRTDFLGPVGSILGGVCGVAGDAPGPVGIAGKVCSGVTKAGSILSTGKTLLGDVFGGGGGGVARKAMSAAVLAGIGLWAAHGAQAALREAAHVIGSATDPQLRSTWFSATYWRIAGLAALLTVPFLFAAAIQALIRTDLALLVRAAFGYLPLAMLGVSIAAPVTMLLLAASDQMSTTVSATAGDGGGKFLTLLGGAAADLSGFAGSTFLALILGIVIVCAATALTLELLVREAAVYVVVLMLPLAFAAMVWPARRVWAARIVELLVALILSKFVIVAVLTLAEGALGQLGSDGVGTVLAGMTLLLLAAFSPWVLLKLIPFAEVSAGIGGALAGERERFARYARRADGLDSSLIRSEADDPDGEDPDGEPPALPERQPPPPAGDDGHGEPAHPRPAPDPGPSGGGGSPAPDPGPSGGGGSPAHEAWARVRAARAELAENIAAYAGGHDKEFPIDRIPAPPAADDGAP